MFASFQLNLFNREKIFRKIPGNGKDKMVRYEA